MLLLSTLLRATVLHVENGKQSKGQTEKQISLGHGETSLNVKPSDGTAAHRVVAENASVSIPVSNASTPQQKTPPACSRLQ